eukprot:9992282-Alexandrium_andersonii.AAC.1
MYGNAPTCFERLGAVSCAPQPALQLPPDPKEHLLGGSVGGGSLPGENGARTRKKLFQTAFN